MEKAVAEEPKQYKCCDKMLRGSLNFRLNHGLYYNCSLPSITTQMGGETSITTNVSKGKVVSKPVQNRFQMLAG